MKIDRSRTIKNIAYAVIALIIVAIGFLIAFSLLPKHNKVQTPTPQEAEISMNQVVLPSGTYTKKDGIENYLIIGLDSTGEMTSSQSYYNNDKADFLLLVSFDNNKKTCNVLQINRDTMATVNQLGVTGQKYGEIKQQIALAHTYGDGLSASCFNTVDAVSGLLYGVNIDYYVALTMDAVEIITDYVGGVSVVLDDDYIDISPFYKKGTTVNFDGSNVLGFVRERQGLEDPTNIARQKRQNLFMQAFVEKLQAQILGKEFIYDVYNATSSYMLTNATDTKVYDLISHLKEYEFFDLKTPDGSAYYDNTFVEFYVDEHALEKTVIDLFYEN